MHPASSPSRRPAVHRDRRLALAAMLACLATGIVHAQSARRNSTPADRSTPPPKAAATVATTPAPTAALAPALAPAPTDEPSTPSPPPRYTLPTVYDADVPPPTLHRIGPASRDPSYDAEPREADGFGWGAIFVLLGLVAAAFAAAWWFLLREMRRRVYDHRARLGQLEHVHNALVQHVNDLLAGSERVTALEKKSGALERSIDQLADEIASRLDPSAGQPSAPASRPVYAERAALPAAAASAAPTFAPAAPAAPTFTPAVPRAPEPTPREELGAWFVQEIRAATGLEAAAVWERYFARLQKSVRDARCRQLYWDRGASILRFHERPSDGYSDTGQCWLVQADTRNLLFFQALTLPAARKKDIPGCQIIAADDKGLSASRLWDFVPPAAAQSAEGWVVQAEGMVEYH